MTLKELATNGDFYTVDYVIFFRKGKDVLHVGTGSKWYTELKEYVKTWGCKPSLWCVYSADRIYKVPIIY